MPKRTLQSEYQAGYESGKNSHNIPENCSFDTWRVLINDNIRKSELRHDEPLIAAYWKGWREGRGL